MKMIWFLDSLYVLRREVTPLNLATFTFAVFLIREAFIFKKSVRFVTLGSGLDCTGQP